MATDLEQLVLQMSADVSRMEKQLARGAQAADRQAGRIEARFKKMNRAIVRDFDSLGSGLRTAGAAIGGTLLIREAQQMADVWTNLRNQLRQYEDVLGPTAAAQDRLAKIATDARAPLESLGLVTASTSRAARALGLGAEETFTAIEAVAKGSSIANTGVAAVDGALRQLGQAIVSPRVQLQEFNSIIEGTPRLAQAFADGIADAGGDIAKLRKLIEEGKVSGKDLFQGLLSQVPTLRAEFAKADTTISGALQNLTTRLTQYVGATDSAIGVSQRLAGGINALANNLDALAEAAIVVGAVFLSSLAGRGISGAARQTIGIFQQTVREASATRAALVAQAAAARQRVEQLRTVSAASTTAATANTGALVRASRELLVAEAAVARQSTLTATAVRGVATATSIAARGFSGLIALLGGPVGAALAVASVVMLTYKSNAEKAAEANASALRAFELIANAVPAAADATENAGDKMGEAAEQTRQLADLSNRAKDGIDRLTTAQNLNAQASDNQARAQKALLELQKQAAIVDISKGIQDKEKALSDTRFQLEARRRAARQQGREKIFDSTPVAKEMEAEIKALEDSLQILRSGLESFKSGIIVPSGTVAAPAPPPVPLGDGAGGDGKGHSTKTVDELEREGILSLARLKNERETVLLQERDAELAQRIAAYTAAGLSASEARTKAEAEVSAEYAAQLNNQQLALDIIRAQDAADLARLQGNTKLAEQLEDTLAVLRKTDDLMANGLSFDNAVKEAGEFVRALRSANDELQLMELRSREVARQIDLAEARGDTRTATKLRRSQDVDDRAKELQNLGLPADQARSQAQGEVEALRQAGLQGEVKGIFSGAIKAAFDGESKEYLRNWAAEALTKAFDQSVNHLAQILWDAVQPIIQQLFAASSGGGSSGGGLGGAIGAILGGLGGGGGGGGGSSNPNFGGSRATGGPVSAGMVYQVHKDETIVPRIPGYVIPKGQGGGSSSFNFAPNIDARGADAAAVARLEARMRQMHAEFESRVSARVHDMHRRGKF